MSKTMPVRWWRDDATRYQTRGPQKVLAAAEGTPALQWPFELLRSTEPTLTRILERQIELLNAGSAAPISRWSPVEPPDPIADVRAALEDNQREIDRLNRERAVSTISPR